MRGEVWVVMGSTKIRCNSAFCRSVFFWKEGRTFNSTKGRRSHSTTSGGGGAGRWWTRRRCMKAKALQTIDTLYMTSFLIIQRFFLLNCTVQVRLNVWLDKARHRLQYPWTSVLSWFEFFFFFLSLFHHLFFSPFPKPLSSLFSLVNSTWVCIYTYFQHNMKNNIKTDFWWGAFILYLQIQRFFFLCGFFNAVSW